MLCLLWLSASGTIVAPPPSPSPPPPISPPSPSPPPATYGSLVAFKGAGQTMQVHAFLGTDRVIVVDSTDLSWSTVEVAFSGGTIESVEAEHGLSAVLKPPVGGSRLAHTVGIWNPDGQGTTYPSGLAMTVTFTSDTNMNNVIIDFKSPDTAITTFNNTANPTVSWGHLPNGYVASIVQDTKNEIYAFLPGEPINTVEITNDMSTLECTPLVDGMTAQMGTDKFGFAFLDGNSTAIPQATPLAACNEALNPSADGATWVSIYSDTSPPPNIEYLTVVVGAVFFDPCETCGFPLVYGSTIEAQVCVPNAAGDACVTASDGAACSVSQPTTCSCDGVSFDPGATEPTPGAPSGTVDSCELNGAVCDVISGSAPALPCFSGTERCLPSAETCLAAPDPTQSGDPITTYHGNSVRYWLSMEHLTPVFEQGPMVVSQLTGPANPPPGLEAYKGAWVVAMEVGMAGLDKIRLAVVDPKTLLVQPNATAPPASDALTTMRLSVGGKQLAVGEHALSTLGTAVTARRLSSKIGSGFVEQIDIEARGLHLRVTSAKANKFADEKLQALGLHLDLEFVTFDERAARGALPEMWGLQPMSEATKRLLDEPKAN